MADDGQPPPTQEASTDQRKVAIESSEVITASADYNCEFSIDFTRIAHTHTSTRHVQRHVRVWR